MSQSIIYPPVPEKLMSPAPKRSRLSLKQNRQSIQGSSSPGYFESKQESACISESEDCVPSDICSIQDENASPNCSFIQAKQPPVPELDSSYKVFASGLPNCGNTCYINSILQVLRYTPNFLKCVHLSLLSQTELAKLSSSSNEVKEAEFFLRLHILYIAMKNTESLPKNVEKNGSSSLLKPVKSLLLSLREVSSTFEEGEQHDAHELLLTILSTFSSFMCHVRNFFLAHFNGGNLESNAVSDMELSEVSFSNTLCIQDKEAKRTKPRLKRRQKHDSTESERISLYNKNVDLGFEGQIQHVIQCLECEKRLERTEMFTNLEVSIADDLVDEDTAHLLKCLTQRTTLHGENKYFCEECCHLNEAQISTEIVSLPSILLLHCSWLRQSSDILEMEKDCIKVLIPISFKTSDNPDIFCSPQDQNYSLYAVVLHLGKSTEGGHYVSFVKETRTLPENIKSPSNIIQRISNIEHCCATEEILLSPSTNRWLLFDDETVSAVYVNESEDIFPYFDFLGITASPCMIFYYKA